MSSKTEIFKSMWWYRALTVIYFGVLIFTVLAVLGGFIVLLNESGFFVSTSFLTATAIVLFMLARSIPWLFFYIVNGTDSVGWTRGEDKFLLLPLSIKKFRIRPILITLLIVTILSGLLAMITNNDEEIYSDSTYEETGFRPFEKELHLNLLGSQKVEDGEVSFTQLEIVNLGSVISNDFGYSTYNPKKTAGNFVKVNFMVTNEMPYSKQVSILGLILVDQSQRNYGVEHYFTCDRPYEEYQDYSSGLRKMLTTGSSDINLKPGVPCKITALFEVSSESKLFNLKLSWESY